MIVLQVAQAKLWGPIYRPGHGWIYGEAGFILVPRMPPYVPPTILPPPRPMGGNGGTPPTTVAEISGTGQPVRSDPSAPVPRPADGAAPAESESANGTDGKNDADTKEP